MGRFSLSRTGRWLGFALLFGAACLAAAVGEWSAVTALAALLGVIVALPTRDSGEADRRLALLTVRNARGYVATAQCQAEAQRRLTMAGEAAEVERELAALERMVSALPAGEGSEAFWNRLHSECARIRDGAAGLWSVLCASEADAPERMGSVAAIEGDEHVDR